MSDQLLQRLSGGDVLVADGAMGTMLMAQGLEPGTPPEVWNVDQRERVIAVHTAYLDAGSQIILTNTFGGNRVKLGRMGMEDRVHELNLSAALLATEAARGRAFVAGDIGPTGEMLMAGLGKLTFEQAVDAFAEQARALVEGGVDLIWIETMSELEEARAAITAVKAVTDLPVFCSLSFGPRGRTMMGESAQKAAEVLWPMGLAAIGTNCGEGLEPVHDALQQMRDVLPDAPLIAKPNAGLPRYEDGKTVYDMPPAEFAAWLQEFVSLGARVVGACCGSGPEHISAIATTVAK